MPATSAALSLGTVVALAGIPLYESSYLQNVFNASSTTFVLTVTILMVVLYIIFILFIKKLFKSV